MEIFDLDRLLEITSGSGFKKREIDSKITQVCLSIKEFNEDEINHFYPQKITSDNENDTFDQFKIIIFSLNKIIISNYEEKNNTRLKSYLLKDISNLELVTSQYNETTLEITFNNSDKLLLNSNEDSNIHWRRNYDKKVKDIYKFLLNK